MELMMATFFAQDESNTITSNKAFESFVVKVLRDFLSTKGRKLLDKNDVYSLGFDAFAPTGVFDDIPTLIEVKYFAGAKGKYYENIVESTDLKQPIASNYKILLIVGTQFDQKNKINMARLLHSRTGVEAEVWDYLDLKTFAGQIYNKYYNSEYTASNYLVKSAINEREDESQKSIQRANIISLLRSKYQNESIVLVLGAGVSQSAGIPSWNDLILHLQTSMIFHLLQDKRELNLSMSAQIIELAGTTFETSPISQMRFIRSALRQKEYNKMVHHALYINSPNTKTNLLDAICTICMPNRTHVSIDSVITYNFDNLLELSLDRFKIEYNVVSQEKDKGSASKLNINHAHGYLPHDVDDFSSDFNLVFSEEDYHQVYKNSYCWSNLTQINSFRDKTCVFIGNSLTDPNLRRLLDISSRQGETPHHFAFLRRTQLPEDIAITIDASKAYLEIEENLKNNYYNTLGINIIWVDEFSEIPEILLTLKQQ